MSLVNKENYFLDTEVEFKDISNLILNSSGLKDWGFEDEDKIMSSNFSLRREIKKVLKNMGFKQNYKSQSVLGFGSEYWVNEETNEVIRISDHFVGQTRSCFWTLDSGKYDRFTISNYNQQGRKVKIVPKFGIANFDDFKKGVE